MREKRTPVPGGHLRWDADVLGRVVGGGGVVGERRSIPAPLAITGTPGPSTCGAARLGGPSTGHRAKSTRTMTGANLPEQE